MAKTARGMLSPDEISTFCAQLAMILKSGISVVEGISIMHDDMQKPGGREIIGTILTHTEAGEPLHMALAAAECFPKYVIDMVEIGAQSGRLDEVMDFLCEYYEREESIAKSVKSAVTYPLIMIVMMVLVIGVLIIKVLPIFQQVFVQLGSEMSAFSLSVMNFGTAVGNYSAVIIGTIAVLVLAVVIMNRTQGGKDALARFQASFFATKRLFAKIASGRFASAMALMLSSGLDTDQSLDMAAKLIDNVYVSSKIADCKQMIAQGSSFSNALEKTGIFTGVYSKMVSVGFKTGSVDTVMKKLADRYEEEVDTQISSMVSLLEPSLVAVLSIIVGMILLSVMLPLMGIMSSIG
ncbi:type II secretion system F family protein [Oscillospiraceae bacterium PP1C4]